MRPRAATKDSVKCEVSSLKRPLLASNFPLPTSNFLEFFLAQESATLSKNTLRERKGGPE